MRKNGFFGTLDPFLEDGPILGRKVANAGFLRFLLAADPFAEYHFFLQDRSRRESLAGLLAQLAPDIAGRGGFRLMDRRELPARLKHTAYSCFHQSDCINAQAFLARLRNACAPEIFPITGPIHSLSNADFPQAFLRHLWAGATPRDCIVATSEAGRLAVEGFFHRLRRAYGLADVPGPSIRRVPLGVDPGLATGPAPTPQRRAELRSRLGLPQDRRLILVLGRISHFSKMDVLPLIRALSRVYGTGRAPRGSAAVVLAGWAEKDDEFPKTLRQLAGRAGVEILLDLRPDERRKTALLSACDLFVSIADNPQETFGISVLEAQAAGLPVVASDYDGYRDLVAPGETGILVPTLGPAPAEKDDFVDRLAPLLADNQYHLLLAQRTAVSTPRLADALADLLADPGRRLRMGAAGRRRILAEYTWPAVIDRYLSLWDELRRLPAPDPASLRDVPHPLELPYSRIFAPYPSATLKPGTHLEPGRSGAALLAGREHPVIYAGLDGILEPDALRPLVFLARKGEAAGRLAERLREVRPTMDGETAAYHILWALKHDLLQTADRSTNVK